MTFVQHAASAALSRDAQEALEQTRAALATMALCACQRAAGDDAAFDARVKTYLMSHPAELRAALDSATQQWGVKVMRIELKNITPPEEIRLTMEKQMTAERTRRAVVTTAEGEKAAAILRAEGAKQSQIVSAEGGKEAAVLAADGQAQARLRVAQAEAQAIQMIAQAIGAAGNPAQYLIAQRYLESLSAIATGAQKVVFLPFEATNVMGSIGGLRELLQAPPIPPTK